MRYRKLGPSGLLVSELCLGTMTFGGEGDLWGKIGQLGQDEADGLVKTALDAGINFIDTANVYGFGNSERILGQSLRNLGVPRDEVVIATKAMGVMSEGPNGAGASRYHLLSQAEESLKRLQLDHIDLYQIHGFDSLTPLDETLEALDTLVRHGKVRYIGLSNWAAWQIMKAIGIAGARQLAPILSLQAYYTLVGRDLERELAPMLKDQGMGLMVWSPLAGGYLSGKYSGEGAGTEGRRKAFDFPPVNRERGEPAIEAMRGMAESRGASIAQIALAWLLHQEVVTSVLVGAKRPEQLTDNIGATEIRLGDDELATLDGLTALPPEYPGWMLERQGTYRTGKHQPGRPA
ncbi:aldo/keto reductase [Pseudoroseicyclus sp. CXY001]|uniref:aldo/keto reductase n=1 Tax=Pseudoroseicyclus sp. CXY001 TaxID=3242492 RepID=UPI0035714EDA